jgi:hypothetical protein
MLTCGHLFFKKYYGDVCFHVVKDVFSQVQVPDCFGHLI